MRLTNFWAYLRQRFPPVNMALFAVVFGTVWSVAGTVGGRAAFGWAEVVGMLVTILFFFRLRVFDEIKDFALDAQNHPQRVLQRGLVTLPQLQALAWAGAALELGWSATVVAEETVIDPATFQLTGKKFQDIRSSINRAAREGVRVMWGTWNDLGVRTTNQIAEISEQWVVEKKLPELGFTLGGLDELRDPDVLIGVATDATGRVQAVTSWLPTWSGGAVTGRTLDFMRRRADGMNGVMEFLIAEAVVRAQLDGLGFLSLSGAPLAVSVSDDSAGPLDRILATVGRSLEPVYGFRSLFAFKQKFQPRLVPLALVYPDALSLPAIGIAVSLCYLPGLTLRESASLVRGLR